VSGSASKQKGHQGDAKTIYRTKESDAQPNARSGFQKNPPNNAAITLFLYPTERVSLTKPKKGKLGVEWKQQTDVCCREGLEKRGADKMRSGNTSFTRTKQSREIREVDSGS